METRFLYVVEPDGCLRAFSDGTLGIEPGRVVITDGSFALEPGDKLRGLVPAMLVGKALDRPGTQAELFGDSHVVVIWIECSYLPEFVRGDVLSSLFHCIFRHFEGVPRRQGILFLRGVWEGFLSRIGSGR